MPRLISASPYAKIPSCFRLVPVRPPSRLLAPGKSVWEFSLFCDYFDSIGGSGTGGCIGSLVFLFLERLSKSNDFVLQKSLIAILPGVCGWTWRLAKRSMYEF